eukprot:GILI01023556.1.p1 GENE.GILI01023556.1~~GILI01023556.1.p1  ORF type:complete len:220 (+),score=55.95 GILI01023556.1:45-704(+)
MPPKKASPKKGKGKKKKGPDENALFNEFLNEMFFMSQVERAAITQRRKMKIREVFALFQERGKDVIDARELGIVVRELGLNPSQKQLQMIQSLAEDSDNPSFIPYAKLERALLTVLEAKEIKSEEVTAEGATVARTSLIYAEPEATIQESFDVLWDALGRKVDHDKQRYLDSDALRELLMGGDMIEAFSEDDVQHFLAAAQDVGTTTINEDLFMMLCLE